MRESGGDEGVELLLGGDVGVRQGDALVCIGLSSISMETWHPSIIERGLIVLRSKHACR